MKKVHRIVIIAAVLCSGLAMAPYFAFPHSTVHWQAFAEVYQTVYRVFMPLVVR